MYSPTSAPKPFQIPPPIRLSELLARWHQQFTENPVLRREIRERWRRPMTFLVLGFYVAVLNWMAYAFFEIMALERALDPISSANRSHDFLIQFSLMQALLALAAGMSLGTPLLIQERERGAWREMIMAGITPAQIIFAKFYSVASFLAILGILTFPTLSLCYLFGGTSPSSLLAISATSLTVSVTSVALALYISAGSSKLSHAMASALMGFVGLAFIGWPVFSGLFSYDYQNFWASAFLYLCLGGGLRCAGYLLFMATQQAGSIGLADDTKIVYNPTPLLFQTEVMPLAQQSTPSSAPKSTSPHQTVRPPISSPPVSGFSRSYQSALAQDDVWRAQSTLHSRTDIFLDTLFGNWAMRNCLAMREWRVRIRGWRSSWTYQNTNNVPIYIGLGVLLIIWSSVLLLGGAEGLDKAWRLIVGLTTAWVLAMSCLVGAEAFVLERKPKMLGALQLTTLSPREIVVGKIYSTLLWVIRRHGVMLVLALVSFFPMMLFAPDQWSGPFNYITTVLGVASCILAVTCLSVAFSLFCTNSSLAALASLALTVCAFGMLPMAFQSSIFETLPPWITWWLTPLQCWMGVGSIPMPLAQANLLVLGNTLLLSVFFFVITAIYLSRLRSDETESLLQRDLNRSWN